MKQKKIEEYRELLRGLIVLYVIVVVLFLLFFAFESISVAVEEGLNIEKELSPLSGFWIAVNTVISLAMLVLLIWGLVEMWRYDLRGMGKLVVVVLFPFFFFDNEVAVYGAITDYLMTLESCILGAIIASSVFVPEIFEAPTDVVESEGSASSPGKKKPAKKTSEDGDPDV